MTRYRAALVGLCAAAALAACAGPEPRDEAASDPAVANANLGLAYLEHGEYQVALTKLKKALSINPDLPQAHHYIAEVYQDLGETESAREHFERAVALDGSDPALQNNYAIFLCSQREFRQALRHFDRAVSDDNYGYRDKAYENAGVCALQIPDTARAERYFRRALELNPRRPEPLLRMAQLEYQRDKYLQARAFLQRYYEVAGFSPPSLALGIKVETALGDDSTAGRYRARLKEEFPQAKETQLLLESDHHD